MDILYLCDKTACKDCGPECNHTTDITHAKSFKRQYASTYVEQSSETPFGSRLIATSIGLTITVGILATGFKFIMWILS